MLLAIDAGNTNLVFALLDEAGEIRARWRIATDPRRTADEYAVWLHQLLALSGHDAKSVEAVIIATVVPRALHNLTVLASKYFGVEALVAGRAPVEWGIALDVVEPERRVVEEQVHDGRAEGLLAAPHVVDRAAGLAERVDHGVGAHPPERTERQRALVGERLVEVLSVALELSVDLQFTGPDIRVPCLVAPEPLAGGAHRPPPKII